MGWGGKHALPTFQMRLKLGVGVLEHPNRSVEGLEVVCGGWEVGARGCQSTIERQRTRFIFPFLCLAFELKKIINRHTLVRPLLQLLVLLLRQPPEDLEGVARWEAPRPFHQEPTPKTQDRAMHEPMHPSFLFVGLGCVPFAT